MFVPLHFPSYLYSFPLNQIISVGCITLLPPLSLSIYIYISSCLSTSTDILTLSRHFSLSFIASGRSSGLQPVCMFELVVLLLNGHMWGSIGVHHLWARPCFSCSVLHVCTRTLSLSLSLSLSHTHTHTHIHTHTYTHICIYIDILETVNIKNRWPKRN